MASKGPRVASTQGLLNGEHLGLGGCGCVAVRLRKRCSWGFVPRTHSNFYIAHHWRFVRWALFIEFLCKREQSGR